MLVVASMTSGNIKNWKLIYHFRQCRELLDDNRKEIVHVFRHSNGVADRLADWAYDHRSFKELSQVSHLPKSVTQALRFDRIGLWALRK